MFKYWRQHKLPSQWLSGMSVLIRDSYPFKTRSTSFLFLTSYYTLRLSCFYSEKVALRKVKTANTGTVCSFYLNTPPCPTTGQHPHSTSTLQMQNLFFKLVEGSITFQHKFHPKTKQIKTLYPNRYSLSFTQQWFQLGLSLCLKTQLRTFQMRPGSCSCNHSVPPLAIEQFGQSRKTTDLLWKRSVAPPLTFPTGRDLD